MKELGYKYSWLKTGSSSSKFSNYFEIYDGLFGHLKGAGCTFIEIGIQGGGSLLAWKDYLGSNSRVIGIDVNPACKSLEQPGIEIFIGDTGDLNFLKQVFQSVGEIRGILDDGGHHYLQQISVVRAVGMYIENECVVAVEDTSTSFYKDFGSGKDKTFLDYIIDLSDFMHLSFFQIYPGRARFETISPTEDWYSRIASIKFFPGIVSLNFQREPYSVEMVTRGIADHSLYNFNFVGVPSSVIPWPNLRKTQEYLVRIPGASLLNSFLHRVKRILFG